jgi:hypothetical protein
MADGVFNIAKGAVAEKVRDGASNLLILLLTTVEAAATFVDRATVALILSNGSTEATATNYARKTALTGTVTVDNTNDRVDVDMPDQTWTALGGGVNNSITKAVVAYEESAADTGRVPLTHHDFVITTDGSDVTLVVNAAGFFRAA